MPGESLIFGLHPVRTMLERAPQRLIRLVLQKGRTDPRAVLIEQLARAAAIPIDSSDGHVLDRMTGGRSHQGAVAHVRPQAPMGEGALDDLLDRCGTRPLVLVLDGVQDPHNLGACLRTADAAGVVAVIVPRDRAASLTATVRKVAAGAADFVPLIQVVNLARSLRWLKERGLWLVGADDSAGSLLYAADLTGPVALVMGAEGSGLRRLTRESCDTLVRIPMAGVVESLNVSVAAGVLLFEAVRQRGLPH